MKKRSVVILFITTIVVITGFIIISMLKPEKKHKKPINDTLTNQNNEPGFRHDGQLYFLSPDGDTVKSISIEIADDENERVRGLMYRSILPDSCGMLFIFENSETRSFWMKNTHIPLDIIYISDQFRLVSIQKNTLPFSEAPLLSEGPARYVVEVNAGFTDTYKIGKDYSIIYILNP